MADPPESTPPPTKPREPGKPPKAESASEDSDAIQFSESMTASMVPEHQEGASLHARPPLKTAPRSITLKADDVTRIGRFIVQELLGEGGFGKVYLAFDETLHRKVAIKAPRMDVTDAAIQRAFLTEARHVAQLKHPGIVGVLDVVTENDRCYIVSDFVDGTSLSKWVKTNRPDWKMSVRICSLIADALAHAHSHRTVHRDLKPANVIMTPQNQPVIVDFGLAVSDMRRADGSGRGNILGTPGYMSPEQAAGAGHRIDGRTDIYSLGVILYQMLTGRRPFESRNIGELLRQVMEDEPQPPRQLNRQLPAEVERICLKAMAKSLNDRYTTADDLASDLTALLTTAGDHSGSSAPGAMIIPASDLPETDFDPGAGSAALKDEGSGSGRVGDPGSARDSSHGHLSSSRQRSQSQRRQVTIVSCGCDVFENESLQELLEADEQADALKAFQKYCRETAVQYAGSILQDTSDGIAVCFGFPLAFEDSVPSAVRFGLAVIQQLGCVNRTLPHGVSLSARIVMHTDVAVVESQASSDESSSNVSVVGTIRNFTSRLEQAAEFDAVLISEQTHRLLRGLFDSEPLEPQRIKGLSGSVSLYRVVRERQSASRVDLLDPSVLSPMIGRDREVGLLQERWEQAAEGMGQVVLIIGDAGLGKSRLVHAMKQHVLTSAAESGVPIIEWRASQQRQNSSLYPAVECFERLLGFDRDDSPQTQLAKLVTHLRILDLDGDHEIALLASLLSIPLNGEYPELKLPPQNQRDETSSLLLDWLKGLARIQPLLFIIEDLHWVDPSTLEFVEQLVDRGFADRILTLLTFRPEFETPWKSKAHQSHLALNRLTKRQIQELMEQTAEQKLPTALVDQIIQRTDGVPLFVEEYTRMLIESDSLMADPDSSASGLHAIKQIPASLQDMLMSRLDRINCDLSVVQLAASIGRIFSWELIRAASQLPENELRQQLDRLVDAELLFTEGRAPRQRYQFKHALLQDAAYNSLVKSVRQEFHARIGVALESQFPDVCDKEPEVVAQHFSDAGIPEKAFRYWGRAGERSLHRYAYREAIQQIRAGLEAIKLLPESRDRHLSEIELHVMLGVPLQSIVGYSAPEVEENYARALALCQELKLTTELFPILYGLFRYYMLQGKYTKAREIGQQLVVLADQSQEADFFVSAHRAAGSPLVYQGDYAAAMPHFDQVLSIPATAEIRAKVNRYDVVDPWIAAGSYKAWALWLTGFPQQALEQSARTVSDAEALKHPFTITLALSFSTWLHQLRRDIPATLNAAERALKLSEEHGFRFWIGWGNVLKHWALGTSGRDPNACEAIRQGIVAWRAQGSELGSSYFYVLQAEIALCQNRLTDAAAALTQAEDFAKTSGEGFPLPDIHRLRGEVAIRVNDPVAAETHFCRAIEVARQQNSRSLELRATVSLAKFLISDSRASQGREMLAALLSQFSEGHDTHDVKEAVALLNSI